MKPPRMFGTRPHVRYRPELTSCPWCGAVLVYSHSVWAKWVQSLDRIEHVTNLGYRCSAPECPGHRSVIGDGDRLPRRRIMGHPIRSHLGGFGPSCPMCRSPACPIVVTLPTFAFP